MYPGAVDHTFTPISTASEPKHLQDPCVSGISLKNKRLCYHNSPSNRMGVIPGRQLAFSPSPSSSVEEELEQDHQLLTSNNGCPENRNPIIESSVAFVVAAVDTSNVKCTTTELAKSIPMDDCIVVVHDNHHDSNETTNMVQYSTSTGTRLRTLVVWILIFLTGMILESPHEIEKFNTTWNHLTCQMKDKSNWTSPAIVQEEAHECRAIPLGMRYVSTSFLSSNQSWILLPHKAADEVETLVAVASQIQLHTLSQEQSSPVKSLAILVASLLSCAMLSLILFYCTGLGVFGVVGMGILVRHWTGKTMTLYS